MNKFSIDSLVFCDSFREEVGGKHTLLGVTSPEVNIGQIPAAISIALWICVQPNFEGSFKIDFRALDIDRNSIVTAKFHGETSTMSKSAFAFGPFPLQVAKPGNFEFEWSFGNDEWDRIGTLKINLVSPDASRSPNA